MNESTRLAICILLFGFIGYGAGYGTAVGTRAAPGQPFDVTITVQGGKMLVVGPTAPGLTVDTDTPNAEKPNDHIIWVRYRP